VKKLLAETADRAARYSTDVGKWRVAPLPEDVTRLEALDGPLPQLPSDPAEVLALLDDIGSPATVATTGARYFGFIIGGSLPAALAANWLAGCWLPTRFGTYLRSLLLLSFYFRPPRALERCDLPAGCR
jgi:hypothetical protein